MCLGIFQVSVILQKDSVALCLKKVLIVLLLTQDSYIFYFKHFFSSFLTSDFIIHVSRKCKWPRHSNGLCWDVHLEIIHLY